MMKRIDHSISETVASIDADTSTLVRLDASSKPSRRAPVDAIHGATICEVVSWPYPPKQKPIFAIEQESLAQIFERDQLDIYLGHGFCSLGDIVHAVILQLRGGFPRINCDRPGAWEEETGPDGLS
jgi:hypothetical protein